MMQEFLKLTTTEVKVLLMMNQLADEAKKAEQLIRDSYRCFGICQDEIEVGQEEYLTHAGVWKALDWSGDLQGEVTCTTEEIFNLLKVGLFVDQGLLTDAASNDKASLCRRFKAFLETTEWKAAAEKEISSPFEG